MSIEIRREGAVAFSVPMPRALFRDARLSFAARGLFAFLWDLPSNWSLRLEHLVTMAPEGRDALRARLRELQDVGAVRIEPIRTDGGQVAGRRWVLVAPDRWAVEAPLANKSQQNRNYAEERIFQSSVRPIIVDSNAKVPQEVKGHQNQAAACVSAHSSVGAAASLTRDKKRRISRASGIVTWMVEDIPQAERIEQQHSTAEISAAVAALAAVGKEAVPGLIQRQIERQCREHELAARRAAAETEYAARLAAPACSRDTDPDAKAMGEQFLASIRGKRKAKHEA